MLALPDLSEDADAEALSHGVVGGELLVLLDDEGALVDLEVVDADLLLVVLLFIHAIAHFCEECRF